MNGGWSAVLVLAAGVTMFAGQTEDSRKLQQAIDLMESRGDMAAARPLLEQASKSADRSVAGRAQLLLAQADERKDERRAGVQYGRIAEDFRSEPAIAAVARTRAAALARASAQVALASPRRLVTSEAFEVSSVSADGRYGAGFVTSGEPAVQDIALCDLETGQVSRLVAGTSTHTFSAPVIAPDGSQVAYGTMDRLGAGTPWPVSLRVVATAPGAAPRVLFSATTGPTILPMTWSPDGTAILTTRGRGAQPGIQSAGLAGPVYAWVAVSDGRMQSIRTFESWNNPGGSRVSGDGAWIAYSGLPRPDPTGQAPDVYIYLMDAMGRNSTAVVTMAGRNRNPVWAADGRALLFVNERSRTTGLYAVAVENGQPSGAPVVLDDNFRGILIGTTPGGLIVARGVGNEPTTLIATRDEVAASVTHVFEGGLPALAPDGRSVAFLRRTGASEELTVRLIDSGEERRFPGISPDRASGICWLPDSSGVIVYGSVAGSFLLLELQAGTYRSLIARDTTELTRSTQIGIAPDGKTMYMAVRPKSQNAAWKSLAAVDMATGATRVIADFPGDGIRNVFPGQSLAVSPDGRTIALMAFENRRVIAVDANGGGTRDLDIASPLASAVAWAPDGQSLLVGTPQAVLRVPAGGGAATPTGVDLSALAAGVPSPRLAPVRASNLSASADGSRIAFATMTTRAYEVWLVPRNPQATPAN
jgi:Tol biopolymer transport system component